MAITGGRLDCESVAVDLSTGGATAAVLTYKGVYVFARRAGEDWSVAFARQPMFLDVAGNRGAEVVTLPHDSKKIFVTLEGPGAPLLRIDRE